MNILLFGAAGDVGRRVLDEAQSRNLTITAHVRNPNRAATLPSGTSTVFGNLTPDSDLKDLMKGHDLIISALRPPEGDEDLLPKLTAMLIRNAEQVATPLLVVGGAARLKLPGKNTTVLTEPGFLPDAIRPIAEACQRQSDLFERVDQVDWTYISPPALLQPGVRTGTYRMGQDELVTAADGSSHISMEDFAIAILDEAQNRRHIRQRFTVGA
ncbi:NAD(P)-dependent oxidoreductase [Sneathiella limimaris]|uniref:NAD(P)-dependent oxidoreductase n=1 Tax=Sneathiella limimaris TaxID=1964213 RepID=UPI00146C1CE4|nr:NAD(P)H-binding protein [Sneathiella limimaris]